MTFFSNTILRFLLRLIYTGPLGGFIASICSRFFEAWNVFIRPRTKKIAGVVFEFLPILAKNDHILASEGSTEKTL